MTNLGPDSPAPASVPAQENLLPHPNSNPTPFKTDLNQPIQLRNSHITDV